MAAFAAFCAFCLVAGGGYAWNDMLDRDTDVNHMVKKFRPVATRAISRMRAGATGFTATCAGLAVVMAYVPAAAYSIGTYAVLSAVYSLGGKRIPVAELLFFPAFYLARIFAGGAAVGIAVSHWLTLCVIFISLFLVVIKRRTNEEKQIYPKDFFELMTAIFGASTLMSYGLYGILGAQSPYAVYSIFFPLAGIMRYLMLAKQEKGGAYPEKTIVQDPFIASVIVAWILFMYIFLYLI